MKRKPRKRRSSAELDTIDLRTILDSMVEAVFVVDDSGRIVLTNRALDELLDRDARGSRPKKLIRSDALRLAVRRARTERVATEVEIEGVIEGGSGERTLTFHAQVSPLPGLAGVVVVLHDVSALKAADRIRRDFVANAAHELRTPLTAIRGYAETLVNGALSDREVTTRFLEGILRQTQRLQRLTEDLALLSRAESAERGYEPIPTDVVAVARDAAASLDSLAKERDVRLKLDLPAAQVDLPVSGRALDEVLVNLLENALKYSKAGDEVLLSLRPGPRNVTFEVKDSGIGIPSRYLSLIHIWTVVASARRASCLPGRR